MGPKDQGRMNGIFSHGYGLVPRKLMRDKEITPEAKAIYSYLASFAGAGMSAYPSAKLMAAELGMGTNRFYKHRKQLVEKGFITITKRKVDGKWENNIYTLEVDPKEQPHLQNDGTETKKPHLHFEDVENEYVENEGTNSNSTNINSNNINRSNKYVTENEEPEPEPKPEPKKKKSRENKFSDEQLALAKLLRREVKKNFPKSREPNIESWADHIRLMMERDKRTAEEVKSAIIWSQNDDFWYSNILSASKLRKQFDKLNAAADREGNSFTKDPSEENTMESWLAPSKDDRDWSGGWLD